MNQLPILLVEDDPDDAFLTMRGLKKARITNPVSVARDGAEALDVLLDAPTTQFGLVLLDLKVPKVHGFEVLRRMREDQRTRRLPVVVLTSSPDPADRERARAIGANDYVTKRINFDEFVKTIGKVATYWLS